MEEKKSVEKKDGKRWMGERWATSHKNGVERKQLSSTELAI